MDTIQQLLDAFFSFKAYVMLPAIIFIIALAVRLPFKKSLLSTVELAVGFAGVFGVLIGLVLAFAAGYDTKQTLELAVHIAAVMFLLPKSAGLIGEAMMPITHALRA